MTPVRKEMYAALLPVIGHVKDLAFEKGGTRWWMQLRLIKHELAPEMCTEEELTDANAAFAAEGGDMEIIRPFRVYETGKKIIDHAHEIAKQFDSFVTEETSFEKLKNDLAGFASTVENGQALEVSNMYVCA